MVQILASAATSWGGPPAVVRDLAIALSAKGVENTVLCLTDPRSPALEFPDQIHYKPCGPSMTAKVGMPSSTRLISATLREVRKAELVHLHEMWHVPHLLGGISAAVIGRPYVVSPHGELDPWSVSQRPVLKRLAWATYQKRIMDKAAGVHALTSKEKSDVESLGECAPVRIIPNGIDVKLITEMANAGGEARAEPHSPYVLFLGRLDPKKGLDVLLEGFAAIAAEHRSTQLVLAGPDTLQLWPSLKRTAAQLGVLERVSYAGFVDAQAKYRLISRAELFVLPSISEGMSIAVLEALACGVPCIVSTQCHIPEVQSFGAGRVVEPLPSAVSYAMSEVLGNESLRRAMKGNARRLAREAFSIERMATEMLRFYEDVLS